MIYQLNKPLGLLSRDLVDYVRYRVSDKKVGHGGTLDPLASGSLLIATGQDTKKCAELLKKDKTYQFSMILGISTPTGDLEANKIMIDPLYWQKSLLKENLIKDFKKILSSFVGKYEQVVPLYSSVKVDGYRLREIVRKGQIISFKENILHAKYKEKEVFLAVPKKNLHIYNLELEGIKMLKPINLVALLNQTRQQIIKNIDLFSKKTERKKRKAVYDEIIDSVTKLISLVESRTQEITVIPVISCVGQVSSGTYIRKLVVDIAKKLKTVAVCSSIHRKMITTSNITFASNPFDY